MSESEKPELDPLKDALKDPQGLWDSCRLGFQFKQIDFGQFLIDLAAKQVAQLAFPGAKQDFSELCEAGCVPEVLGAILFLFRIVPSFEGFWVFLVGNPERRHQLTHTLQAAAGELDHFFPMLPNGASEERLRERTRVRFAAVGHLHPSVVASELRFYTAILNLADTLAADTEARNIREVLKYVLAGYVKRVTGRFHHRNVSGLLAELGDSAEFSEEAQRMWLNRHYSLLNNHFSYLADFLFDMGLIIARSRP